MRIRHWALAGLCVLPFSVAAQAETAAETEMLFWKSVAEFDTVAEYGAYLQAYPSGQFAELAKARDGVLSPSALLARAIEAHRAVGLHTALMARDAQTGEPCSLNAGDVVSLTAAIEDDAALMRVVTAKRGGCAVNSVVAAAVADLGETLAGFAPPPAKVNEAAGAAEVLFWQSISHGKRVSDYKAYLKAYPNGAFAQLAALRAADAPVAAEAAPAAPQTAVVAAPAAEPAQSEPKDVEAALAMPVAQWLQVQRSLEALGFNAGGADGMPGDRTRQAIRQYQHSQNAAETGYMTQALLGSLMEQAREPLRLADAKALVEQKRQADLKREADAREAEAAAQREQKRLADERDAKVAAAAAAAKLVTLGNHDGFYKKVSANLVGCDKYRGVIENLIDSGYNVNNEKFTIKTYDDRIIKYVVVNIGSSGAFVVSSPFTSPGVDLLENGKEYIRGSIVNKDLTMKLTITVTPEFSFDLSHSPTFSCAVDARYVKAG